MSIRYVYHALLTHFIFGNHLGRCCSTSDQLSPSRSVDSSSVFERNSDQAVHLGVTTVELDNLAAQKAASMTVKHPHYGILAGRIAVSNLHKETKEAFSGLCLLLAAHCFIDLLVMLLQK